MLDYNQEGIGLFSKRGRPKNIDVFCLSQSNFDSPERTIRNNRNKKLLIKQPSKEVGSFLDRNGCIPYDLWGNKAFL